MRKKIKSILVCLLISASALWGEVKVLQVDGGKIYQTILTDSSYLFDHAEYAVFVPDGIETLRGVFIHQHGCTMEGMGASTSYDIQYQSFAKKWNLAIVGPDIFPKKGRSCRDWIDAESGSGDALTRLLQKIGTASGHDELQAVPWLLWGHSGGGYWTLSMMKNYPEKILGVFSYSPAFDPDWEYPLTAYKIPLLIRHAGANDLNGKNVACWTTAIHTFDKFRGKNGQASIAYTPDQNHNYSFVRYMAIPFYEAVLSQRLPDNPFGKLKDMDASKAWLGDTLDCRIYKSTGFSGDKKRMSWLPDSLTATKWQEYVTTGSVSDKTPPPAPYDLRIHREHNTRVVLTWKADADIESGIQFFTIRVKDGNTIRIPNTGDYQKFDTNGDNTVPIFTDGMRCVIAKQPDMEKIIIFVSSTNHFGLESPFSEIAFSWK
jgi:pimeloyl-ACP methyl ester carboxylesterase